MPLDWVIVSDFAKTLALPWFTWHLVVVIGDVLKWLVKGDTLAKAAPGDTPYVKRSVQEG